MSITNLPSTFVASLDPARNFYGSAQFTVGNAVPISGVCTGLLQIPTLPPYPTECCGTVTGAYLQLTVDPVTLAGALPATINIRKITSAFTPSTVTYNTRPTVDTVSTPVTVTINSVDIGTTVQVDVTSLISSWYTTSFPGLELDTLASGPVYFTPTPTLDITCQVPSKIVGHQITTAPTETLNLAASTVTSTVLDVSQQNKISYFVRNTAGGSGATIDLELSPDNSNFFIAASTSINLNASDILTTTDCANYARLSCTSTGSATIAVDYVGQA